jgi:hypothetical protein
MIVSIRWKVCVCFELEAKKSHHRQRHVMRVEIDGGVLDCLGSFQSNVWEDACSYYDESVITPISRTLGLRQ